MYGHSEKSSWFLFLVGDHFSPCSSSSRHESWREKDLRLLCLNKSLQKSHVMGFLPTVGRIPASVDMVNIPLFTGFIHPYTSQVVQDFFHQQYLACFVSTKIISKQVFSSSWIYSLPGHTLSACFFFGKVGVK